MRQIQRAARKLYAGAKEPSSPSRNTLRNRLKSAISHLFWFRRAGRLAFAAYFALLVLLGISYLTEPSAFGSLLILIAFTGFLGLLIFCCHFCASFYQSIGDSGHAADHPLMLLFLGMPLYILLYFRQEKNMQQELLSSLRKAGLL